MNKENKIPDPFWSSSLADIESSFLRCNESVTDMPTHLDDVVPHQGSVLLDSVHAPKTDD